MRSKLSLILALLLIAAAPALPILPTVPIVKGLAELNVATGAVDRALMGVTQYYHWGSGCGAAFGCLNMNRNWTLPQTNCYDTLLLGNEPTNPEPAGHPVAASVAASITVAIEASCPSMKLVAANIHLNNGFQDDFNWLAAYLAAYKALSGHDFGDPHRLGVHCYSQYAQTCLTHVKDLGGLHFAGKFWLTEFAMWGPAPYTTGVELAKFLAGLPFALPNRIERAYIWTNRDGGSVVDLVNSGGALTAMGQVWANWQPPTVRQVWFPLVYDRATQAYP